MTQNEIDLEYLDEAANLLFMLANPKRLHMMKILVNGEIAVTDLADAVNLSQSAISQHLAKFRAANIVATRRSAQNIYYRCNSSAVRRLLDALPEICRFDYEDKNDAASWIG